MRPQPLEPSDRVLVDRVVHEGDEHAFRALYRRHTPYLFPFVLRMLRGDEPVAPVSDRPHDRLDMERALALLPDGYGAVSVRAQVQRAHEIIATSGLDVVLHAYAPMSKASWT